MPIRSQLCLLFTHFWGKRALRWLATLSIFFILSNKIAAQEAVISSYFNAATPNDEWTEILVISDNLNMGGWYLHDNNAAQQDWQDSIVFNSIPFWNNMRAGTIIMIWHRSTSGTGSAHTLEVNKIDGYIELDASNATYFHGGVFTGNNNTMNVAASGDIYELKKPNYQHVHSLSHKTTVDSCYNNMPVPKLNYKGSLLTGDAVYVFPGSNLADYGTPAQNGTTYTAKGTDITFGLPNNSSSSINSNFWRLTRQPVWTAPVLSATPNAAFTQVSLSWNTCTDPYFTDGTVGYVILRNATNSFTDPLDGTSYANGATIGTATVVSNIASTGSPNYSYTDNITITCGNTIYYRIYAYRYSDDNIHLNTFNIARGRAYNETFAATTAIGPTASVAPNSITVDRNNFCADDPGDIVLTAVGGNGASIEWFDNICGGNLIGTTNSLTIASPTATTTYFARWISPGCGPSICKSVQVTVNNAPNITSATPLPASCGNDNGSITIIANGGIPPYWYSIDNGANWGTNGSFTLLPAGTYLVKVKDANCESLAVSVIVALSGSTISYSVSHQNVECYGDNDGTATVSANGGVGSLTYSWNTIPAQFGATASNLSPGTYICTISDGSCSIDVTVEITEPLAALSGGILTHSDVDCSGNSNGNAEISTIGGTEPYMYLWNTVPAQNGAVASNLSAGNYSCTVTDDKGCFIIVPVSISQPSAALLASILSQNGVSCFGNSDGSATVNVTGGTVSYFYEWNTVPIQNTATASNLPLGNYTCNITDAHGCTTSASANISQPALLTGSVSAQTSFICEGATNGTATILPNGGTPGYTFLWNTAPAQSTATASNLPVGSFNCTVKDAKGCEAYVPVTIAAFPSPTAADAGSHQTVCGLNTNLNGNQPAIGTGNWLKISGPNTLTIVSPTTNNTAISTTAPGIFNLTWTITNEPSCPSSSDTVTVEFGNAVTVLAGSNSPVCSNNNIELTSSIAMATYSWSGPVGFSSTEQNPVRNNAITTFSGDYIVNVSGIQGNCPNTSDTIQVNVVNSPSPPVTVNSNFTLVCANDEGNIILTASGGSGTAVEWFEDFCSGTPIGTGISLTIPSPNVTTTYFARWTSGTCGNSACQSVLVNVSEPPTAANAGNPQTICGFSTSLHGNNPVVGNGYWSQFSGPPTLTIVSPSDTNSLVTSTGPGVFELVWSISSGTECEASSDTVTIEFGDAITVLASSNSPVCTTKDLQLSSSITGATYSWRGPAGFVSSYQNPVRNNSTILYSGDYIVDVSGIQGNCPQTSDTVHVIINESPSAPVGVNSNLAIVCANDGGNIFLTANGGSGTALEWYESSLSNPSIGSGPSISISSPDTTTTYFALWTSANCGNSSSKSVTVFVAEPPTIAVAGNAKTICGFSTTLNGNIPVVGTGIWAQVSGPPTLTIVSPTNAKSTVTSTGPGIFDLVWTTSNDIDCPKSTDTTTLEFGNTISVVASSNSPVCSGDTIKLYSSITGATYSWKGPNNFLSQIQNPVISNINPADSGEYIVFVSGISGGCPNTSDTIFVKLNKPPSITSSADSICSGQTVMLTAFGCNGVVTWSDGSKGTTISKNLSTSSVFTATCTDNSCETESGIPVKVTVVPSDFEAIAGNSNVCEKGTIQLGAIGTATTYKWTTPGGTLSGNQNFRKDTATTNDSGFYKLLSTSSKGCTDNDSIKIQVNLLPVINISVKDTACVGSTEVFDAGEGFADYLWQNESIFSTCPALDEGKYWVRVTDSNGCIASDTAWLKFCPADIYIPNAFSPNGDGKNEQFRPVTGGMVLLEYSMTIFNRWGQIIFQSEDYLTGWDGKMNGAELPGGTYIYLITYKISDTANQTLSNLLKNRGTVLMVK